MEKFWHNFRLITFPLKGEKNNDYKSAHIKNDMKTAEWIGLIIVVSLIAAGGIGFIFKLLWDIKSEIVLIRVSIPSDKNLDDKIEKKIMECREKCQNHSH